MNASINTLHDKARRAVAGRRAQVSSSRRMSRRRAEAGRDTAAERQGHRQVASMGQHLLKWRSGGYRETPFGPQSKAKRAAVQSTKQSRRPMTAEEALAQKAQAEFQTARAVAVARDVRCRLKTNPGSGRKELLKALRALASITPRRSGSGLIVERQRARLNLTWDDLIVPPKSTRSSEAEAA